VRRYDGRERFVNYGRIAGESNRNLGNLTESTLVSNRDITGLLMGPFPSHFPSPAVMKVDSLHKLYVHQLKDLYNAERQLTRALPKLAKHVKHDELRSALEEHVLETEKQIERLERVFEDLEYAPTGETCAAMKGLVEEGEEAMEAANDDVRDAAIIAAAQRVEHYEIAGYGTVVTYAKLLGRSDDVRLLEEILNEEKAADAKLNTIALEVVNEDALMAA